MGSSWLGSKLIFENINKLKNENGKFCNLNQKNKGSKYVLKNVTGLFKNGLNAVIGSSGSGKTTLLNILAGLRSKNTTGRVSYVNFAKKTKTPIIGHLVQHDVLMPTVTVSENIWYSCNLRMKMKLSKNQMQAKIDSILKDLQLTRLIDSVVGNNENYGISGGEKKLVALAIELLNEPHILILDEPTSGLDAASSYYNISTLKNLSESNKIIVMSIQQPSSSIFQLFDSVTLLHEGEMIYQGSPTESVDYFLDFGFRCNENPANLFMEIIDSLREKNHEKDSDVESSSHGITSLQQLVECYRYSPRFEMIKDEISKAEAKLNITKVRKDCNTTFCNQLKCLSHRFYNNTMRKVKLLLGNVFINILIGIMFGVFYYQINLSSSIGSQNRFGVLFFVCTTLLFGSISSVEAFQENKRMFAHEYTSRYYGTFPFYISKITIDILPIQTLSSITCYSATYVLSGLKQDFISYVIFISTILLTLYTAISLGIFISQVCTNAHTANTFLSLIFIFSIMFAGLLVNISHIATWLQWLKYLSIANYSYKALCINEFKSLTFSAVINATELINSTKSIASSLFSDYLLNSTSSVDNLIHFNISGTEFLKVVLSVNVTKDNNVPLWEIMENYIALLLMMFILTILGYYKFRKNANNIYV